MNAPATDGNTRNRSAAGLTSEEARRRLRTLGANEIVPSRLRAGWDELQRVLLDPMGLMLLGLAALYGVLGQRSDAVVLLVAYVPVTAVDVALQLRARKALQALKATLRPTAKVLRDGRMLDVPVREIVPGDVIAFEEGQALPADGTVLQAEHLSINEAALTGESIPVDKVEGNTFSTGTVVLSGRGLGAIELTGSATRYGQIAALLQETEAAQTPLQRKVHALVRAVLAAAVALGTALFAAQLWRGHSVMEGTVSALTLAMAAVPEEFPLVFTLYLSLGAWRLSRWGVLVKSLPSVEALGSVDVICTDKTGTLTEGKFQLEPIHPVDPALGADLLWQAALMACEPDPVDAMDMAIVAKAGERQGLLAEWRLTWDYPFEPQGKHMSHAWTHRDGRTFMAMKGAVEGVLEHCTLDARGRERVMALVSGFASQGKRLLGLACRDGGCVGDRSRDETGLTFAALLVFSDPPRSSAKAAIAECQAAGIEVKMLTGDHPLTAHAVADETGIAHDHGKLYTGGQLAQLDQDARWTAYREGAIFSRVMPEQKHEMVRALQSRGQVVAMTGDGINDAPALKLADIGISMGVNATDVARSTAKMVLLKNDFRGIVAAVLEGRRIFANLQRSFAYLISFHLPVVLLALVPPFAGWGDLLLPVNIVLLELIVHPISAFAFENLPATPAPRGRGLLPPLRTAEAVLSGLLLTGVSLILFRSAVVVLPIEGARTLALAAVLFGNLGFVLVESWPSRSLKVAATGAGLVALTLAIILVPAISAVFHLSALSAAQLALACAVGLGACVPSFIVRAWQVARAAA